jgi:hypothetical protein
MRQEPGLADLRIERAGGGGEVDGLATIGDLASLGFRLSIGESRSIELAPLLWVPTRWDMQSGVLSLEEIVRRGSYLRVAKALRMRPGRTMSVPEFLNLASDSGVPPDEGRDLLRIFHRAGVVVHFHRDPDPKIRDLVFLKPDEALDALHAHFGLEGPHKAFVREQRAKKEAELASLKARLADRRAARELVEREAGTWAVWSNRMGFSAMTAGVMVYGWLTFDYLSWDLMEPITYATGTVTSLLAYWWWILSERELGFASFAETIKAWRRKSLYRGVLGRDSAAGDSTVMVATGAATVADPTIAYEDDLARLEARVAAEEAEVELLARTEYSPALLQYYEAIESSLALPATMRLTAGSSSRSGDMAAVAAAAEEEAVLRSTQLLRLVTAATDTRKKAEKTGEEH